ncbi:MAG: hypothetical protein AAF502_16565 [Bacteroidota bacterium]
MKKYAFLMMLAITAGFFQSCQQDEVVEPEQRVAPELPKQEMLIMPFRAFEDLDTNGIVREDPLTKDMDSYHNWFHSAVNVFVWNTAVTVNMALPVLGFFESFNHQPIYAGNGVFQWIYDVQTGNDVYFIVLSGQYVSGDIHWEMKASKLGGFTDVIWYSGVVSGDGSGATWTLNHKPNNPEPYLSVTYSKDVNGNFESIRYTNIIPGHVDNGDYIEYRVDDPSAGFNRAYDVYGGNANDFIEIRWNEPTREGQVKHPGHFDDNNWHCWGMDLIDTDC